LNYLDDWLILAQSVATEPQILAPLPSGMSWAQDQLFQEHAVPAWGQLSTQMRAWLTPDRTLSIQQLAALFMVGSFRPLRTRPTAYASPSVLAKTQSSSSCMATWPLTHQGVPRLYQSPVGKKTLSINASSLEFRPNDYKVVLRPRHGYV